MSLEGEGALGLRRHRWGQAWLRMGMLLAREGVGGGSVPGPSAGAGLEQGAMGAACRLPLGLD